MTLLDIGLCSSSTTNVSIACEFVRKLKNEENVEEFRSFHQNMKRVLTFLLGFFVTQTIRRWWNQTSKIPHLTDLAVICNAIFQPGTLVLTYECFTFKLNQTVHDCMQCSF